MSEKSTKLSFGKKLAEYLEEAETTRDEIARRAGLRDPETITKLLDGMGQCKSLYAICSEIALSVDQFDPGDTIFEGIKRLREKRGWSQNFIAKRAGVSPQAVARVEAGGGTVVSLEAVLRELGVCQEDLVFRKNPRYRKERLRSAISILAKEGIV